MNKFKILLVFFSIVLLGACASHGDNIEFFQKYTAKQLLAQGTKQFEDKNYKESIRYFEAIDALYPFAPEAKQGQLYDIYAYYKEGNNASATAAADRYIHLYPVDEHTAYAYYIKGKINLDKDRSWIQKIYTQYTGKYDLSSLQEAYVDFDMLVKYFPKSTYAKEATKQMLYIRNLLVERELSVAQFYFDRRAYVAAANRASYIVQNFDGVPQVLDALKIMIKSYRALGATDQEASTLCVLKRNFPEAQI